MNSLGSNRDQDWALHPTVKTVATFADAIKDVSKRDHIDLDLFGGSGSPIIAAHKTRWRGFLCELDPLYCDRIIRRWQIYAKNDAVYIATGKTFKEVQNHQGFGTCIILEPPKASLAQTPLPASQNQAASPNISVPQRASGVRLPAAGSLE